MTASHTTKLDFVKLFSDKAGRPLSSFVEVKAAIDTLRYPEQRGAAFEAFSTAVLATDPKLQVEHIYRVADAPSSLLKALGIVNEADNGIDRLIVDKIGRVIAVQQKFHLKPEQNVVYSDLPTFFQQATNVSHHLIATTAVSVNLGNKVVKNLSIAEANTMTVMGLDAHMELRADHIVKAVGWLAGKVETAGVRFTPKPHQLAAIKDVTKYLKRNDRAIHHSACGTGKTLSSILMAEQALTKGGTVLVMEPTLTLIKQNLAVWASEIEASGRPVSFLVACSDETVVNPVGDDISRAEVGFPVTTHDGSVSTFLKQKRRPGELRVVFSTYHSSDVIEKASKAADFKFDLGIFDEAHRMVVSQVQNDLVSNFSRALFDDNIPLKKRLFQTATLKNIQLKGYVPADQDIEVVSMDNEALFGRVAHSYSFGQAADAGVIRRVKLLVVQVDVNDLPVELKSLRVKLERAEVNGHVAAHIASLQKAVAACGARKIISFHGSKRSAEVFADLSQDALQGFQTGVVHSGQKATTRAKTVKLLEGTKPALVTNVRCLTEGMDAPATDLVALLAEIRSEIDITQIIGRCVRMPKNPVSDHGHVLLPLVISKTEHMSRDRLADIPGMKAYREVFKVLLALDPEFQSAYLTFRKAKANNDPKATEDARAVLDQHIGFIDFTGDDLADLIRVSSIDPIEGNFWDNFDLLEAIVRRHGLDHVTKSFVTEDGTRLGLWLANQKTFMLSGRMDERREAALRGLGINPASNDSRFDAGLAALTAFVEKHGHCKVPAHGEHHKLRVWLDCRRRDFNRGSLSEQRKQAIEACGFSFDIKKEERFEEGYGYLLAYFAANRHSNVPHRYVTEEGYELGRFVCGYLRDKSTFSRLAAHELAQLHAVDFKQDGREHRLVEALEAKYAQFKAVYDEFGTFRLPASEMPRFRRYKGNLSAVRTALREDRVNADLRERFAALGLVQPVDLNAVRERRSAKGKVEKPVSKPSFDQFIRLLRAHIKAGGPPNVPQNGPTSMFKGIHLGGRLNSWLKAWRDGELSEKQVATLEGLGVLKYRKAPKGKKPVPAAA